MIIINNPNLANLKGLENLVRAGSLISISKNDALTNLQGLESLTVVPFLDISNMPSLTTLQGLNNVSTIYDLNIYGNPELLTIDALRNISAPKDEIIGKISITACPRLTGLPNFNNIISVGKVYITDNASLSSLEGLHHIRTIWTNLVIANNASLESLKGLRGITGFQEFSIANTLIIEDNDILTSLNGFENIKSFHGYITVSGNHLLSDFCAISHMLTTEQGFDVGVSTNNNMYNPTSSDFTEGNCSQ